MDVSDSGAILSQELHRLRSGVWIRIPRVQISINLHEHMMGEVPTHMLSDHYTSMLIARP